jgi:hypothetical protein
MAFILKRLIVRPLIIIFCSACDHYGIGKRPTSIISCKNQATSWRAMVLVKRELEHHYHHNYLHPSPTDACAHAGGTLPKYVQHVYEHRRDAC